MPPKAAAAAPKGKAKAKKTEKTEEEDEHRVPQPDRAELDAAIAKICEVIDGFQKQKAALAQKISERSGGKEEFFGKKDELRNKLNELSTKINGLMERKQKLNGEIDSAKAERLDMRDKLTKMKKSIGFKSEQEIDEHIASIEFKLSTETMQLKDEKAYLKEISELKKNRPKVSQVNKMQDSLDNRDNGSSVKESIANINAEIGVYKEAKDEIRKQLNELMEGRKEQLGDLPTIVAQHDEINAKIQEQVKKRNELRDEFREKEKEWNAYRNEQRAKRQEKYAEERRQMQEERERRARERKVEKLDEQPHIDTITLIEQTITFCKSLVQTKTEEVKEEKKETEHNLSDGKAKLEVLAKKEDRDEEYYYAPTKAKKKGKAKSAKADSSSKPIKHNAATFKLFDDLKLDAPITTDDVPATLEKLEAQLDEYKKKVEEWEQNREELKRKILEEGLDPDAPADAEKEDKKDEE